MLTDIKIKNLKPKSKLYRVSDSNGLCIEVCPNGSKLWRYRYRFNKKATMVSLGIYPDVSLLDARQSRDNNRQLLKQGINPKHNTQQVRSISDGVTFKDMFLSWHNTKNDEWSEGYARDIIQRAECYLMPYIGNQDIRNIKSPDMRKLLLNIQDAGLIDTLQKVKGIASRVFSFSVGMGVIDVNPVRDLPIDIFKKKPTNHYATITEPSKIGWLLRMLSCHKGSHQVKTALSLAPHLFLRPSELVGLLWSEVYIDERIIRIGGARMKMGNDHLVPMSDQVHSILIEYKRVDYDSPFVFPTPRNRSAGITTNSLLAAIRSLGIGTDTFTTHGFRHMASTRLNELGFRPDVIERQLAHSDSNKIRAVYNQAEYLEERKEMMQQWSDYLEKVCTNYVV